jgi:hypothetical protein
MHIVYHPRGALAGTRSLPAPADSRDWHTAYGAFVIDVRREVLIHLPSFETVDAWRGHCHRVLARNVHADIGVTTSAGLAWVWLAERTDREFRRRAEWSDARGQARRWLLQIAPRFDRLLTTLGCQQQLRDADAQRELPAAA